jgi:hypothetical protein
VQVIDDLIQTNLSSVEQITCQFTRNYLPQTAARSRQLARDLFWFERISETVSCRVAGIRNRH